MLLCSLIFFPLFIDGIVTCRKLNKISEKRFKKHQNARYAWQAATDGGNEPEPFIWKTEDFKDVPDEWVRTFQIHSSIDTIDY